MNQTTISLPSFAKVNWRLRILGKRPDGLHELETILQTISLHDHLHFDSSENGSIAFSCDEPAVPADETNLVVRAASTLRDFYGVKAGARIRLEKRIPFQAGLGGGSSNAAVTMLGLVHLWQITATTAELMEIAASLGADVPFFLLGGRAGATGIGVTVSSLPDEDTQHLIVIKPNAAVATSDAYAALDCPALTTSDTDSILSSSPAGPVFSESSLGALNNDFESVIFDIEPEIRRTKNALLQAGAAKTMLAGSGSSVFGVFSDLETQQRAFNEIELEAGWRIFPCVTLSRNEYIRALMVDDVSLVRSFKFESDFGA